ncbi:MAG: HlyD family efflux transporter periplasmic adaptor subunit [Bdellovibrionales bacterium]|nr:HlyD family efflux transporter periplasmic adaptor subunit [Bdellovibrionales bacterium]
MNYSMNKKIEHWTQDHPIWLRWARRVGYIILAILFSLLFIPWMQTATSEGRVIALAAGERRQDLSAPVEGRILKWYVNEGGQVKKGDKIVELVDNDPQILDRLERERDALQKKFESIEISRKTSAINVQRQKTLFEQGLSSRRQYELAKIELAKLESDEAASLAEMSRMDVKFSRQEQLLVTAPADGTLVRILKNANGGVQFVTAGEKLAILVPETSSRAVELWVRGTDMPWVVLGRRVALQFDGWPALQFSGLPGLSVGTFFGEVNLIDALDDGQGNFRVLVTPEKGTQWPPPHFLKQGVRTLGWIMLGEVSLGFEVWRKFNGFPPSNLPVYQPGYLDGEDYSAPKKGKSSSGDKDEGK